MVSNKLNNEFKTLKYVLIVIFYKIINNEKVITMFRWMVFTNYKNHSHNIDDQLKIEKVLRHRSFKRFDEKLLNDLRTNNNIIKYDDFMISECSTNIVQPNMEVKDLNDELLHVINKIIFNEAKNYNNDDALLLGKFVIGNQKIEFTYLYGDPIPF